MFQLGAPFQLINHQLLKWEQKYMRDAPLDRFVRLEEKLAIVFSLAIRLNLMMDL